MIDVSKLDLPDWVAWIAQDADGIWWGYEVEPLRHDNGWYENEVGRNVKILSTETCHDWQETLIKVQRS
ncbi:hypothetical protein [Kaarinaea lacus]